MYNIIYIRIIVCVYQGDGGVGEDDLRRGLLNSSEDHPSYHTNNEHSNGTTDHPPYNNTTADA